MRRCRCPPPRAPGRRTLRRIRIRIRGRGLSAAPATPPPAAETATGPEGPVSREREGALLRRLRLLEGQLERVQVAARLDQDQRALIQRHDRRALARDA